jgi:hypothetical protein
VRGEELACGYQLEATVESHRVIIDERAGRGSVESDGGFVAFTRVRRLRCGSKPRIHVE